MFHEIWKFIGLIAWEDIWWWEYDEVYSNNSAGAIHGNYEQGNPVNNRLGEFKI